MRANKLTSILLLGIMFMVITTTAYAGVGEIWAGVKGAVTAQTIVWILSAIMGIGIIFKYTDWVSTILISLGGLIISVGFAIQDHKINKDELQAIKDKWLEFYVAFSNRKNIV